MADLQLGMVRWTVFAEMAARSDGPDDIMPIGFVPVMLLVTLVCLAQAVHPWTSRVSAV